MAESSQRRALGALFLAIAAAFAGIAISAAKADKWAILAAAAVIALWMAGLGVRSFRR
jgi:hypothetical protein